MSDTLSKGQIVTAWDLVTKYELGFDSRFRIVGGRAEYSDANYNDGNALVYIGRVEAIIHDGKPRLKQVGRYVSFDTKIEIINHPIHE